jgi:hypothetical protein
LIALITTPSLDTTPVNDDRDIDVLFTKPNVSLLPQPVTRRTRQRRTFDMTNVRQSAKLAKKPAIPMVEHAQRNLRRKLGHTVDEETPIEEVLLDTATFHGPLPAQVIDVMSVIFNLDDKNSDRLDEALLQHAGTTVADLDPT